VAEKDQDGPSGWAQAGDVISYDQAIDALSAEIRTKPTSADAYLRRGTLWQANSEVDRAIADFSEAIRLDLKSALAFNSRGHAWLEKDEYEKASNDFDEAIKFDPKLAAAFNGRGAIWKHKKAFDKASNDFDEAIRLDPSSAPAHNNRAWLLATCPNSELRDGKKAVESATRACELAKWKDGGYLDTLAAASAEAGDFTGAVKWQENAITLLSDPMLRGEYRARLALYRAKTPYRESRGAD
jgi:tetratricopeptide (TPR) repeat protein